MRWGEEFNAFGEDIWATAKGGGHFRRGFLSSRWVWRVGAWF